LDAYGVFYKPQVAVVPGRPATEEELLAVHAVEYIEAVKRASKKGADTMDSAAYGIGPGDNPVFAGMHDAASFIAGSSALGAELVMSGKYDHAINISGGLHHAQRMRASGFCVYNDAACAIAYASENYGVRVAYIDIDAHHGDGVQWAFYDRSDILTVSLHESGRFLFPGTGFVEEIGTGEGEGYSVNVPLDPGTSDEAFMHAFNEVVVPIVRAFKPDLIVSQNGCDTHETDPLAGLSLTTNAYEALYGTIHDLAHELCGGRLVALGGGGYRAFEVVPRAWSLLSADLIGVVLSDDMPGSWREVCANDAEYQCPRKLRDPALPPSEYQLGPIREKTEQVIEAVKQKIFPYHGL
jgi:acetoin utilization protein AcuC